MLKFAALVPNCMFVYIGCLSECNSLGIYVRTFFLLTMSWEFSVSHFMFHELENSVTRLGHFLVTNHLQNAEWLFGLNWKTSLLGKNCCGYFFEQLVETFGRLFTSKSGHSAVEVSSFSKLSFFARKCFLTVTYRTSGRIEA